MSFIFVNSSNVPETIILPQELNLPLKVHYIYPFPPFEDEGMKRSFLLENRRLIVPVFYVRVLLFSKNENIQQKIVSGECSNYFDFHINSISDNSSIVISPDVDEKKFIEDETQKDFIQFIGEISSSHFFMEVFSDNNKINYLRCSHFLNTKNLNLFRISHIPREKIGGSEFLSERELPKISFSELTEDEDREFAIMFFMQNTHELEDFENLMELNTKELKYVIENVTISLTTVRISSLIKLAPVEVPNFIVRVLKFNDWWPLQIPNFLGSITEDIASSLVDELLITQIDDFPCLKRLLHELLKRFHPIQKRLVAEFHSGKEGSRDNLKKIINFTSLTQLECTEELLSIYRDKELMKSLFKI